MNSITWFNFRNIVEHAEEVTVKENTVLVGSREIQNAIRLVVPGELVKYAASEGVKAVMTFNMSHCDEDKSLGKIARKKLQLPIGRVRRLIKESVQKRIRVRPTAAVYVAAVLKHIAKVILEQAGNAARDAKVVSIIPRHILLAIRGDEDLDKLFHNKCIVAGGGVVPNIRLGSFDQSDSDDANNPKSDIGDVKSESDDDDVNSNSSDNEQADDEDKRNFDPDKEENESNSTTFGPTVTTTSLFGQTVTAVQTSFVGFGQTAGEKSVPVQKKPLGKPKSALRKSLFECVAKKENSSKSSEDEEGDF